MKNTVLIVRHGPGRGRQDGYMDPVLEFMQRQMPNVSHQIRVYETGESTPSMDGVSNVVFFLADPLREFYPECYDTAAGIAAEARDRGIAMINPPDSLSNTIRTVQSKLWAEAGIPSPTFEPFDTVEELFSLLDTMPYPVIIRSDRHHAQMGLFAIRSEEELAAINVGDIYLPGAVAPLVDVRVGHQKYDPQSIYARLYHKKRIYVLGSRVRTEHIFFSHDPIVSSTTFSFLRYGRVPRVLHWMSKFDTWNRKAIHEDLTYWRQKHEHESLMQRAASSLGISFGAIDYSDLGDGKVILWEMNPHPSLPPLEMMPLPGPRRTRERLESYHQAIALFIENLVQDGAQKS